MDELLKRLLESDVLTEETQQKISEALQQHIQAITEEAEKEAELRVRAELTEQFVNERNMLIEAVDAKVMELLEGEIAELKEDIERFRDLEAEYAGKLVQEKEVMAEQLKQDMATLLKTLDSYLEERLQMEFEELKEDIEDAKKDRWGRNIFETFAEEFAARFVDEDSLQAKLHEATEKLEETYSKLAAVESKNQSLIRESKMNALLEPLQGRQREVMETILQTVDTDKLDETYTKFIGRIINESVNPKSEKESVRVLAEGDKQSAKVSERLSEQVVVKDGNKQQTVVESYNDKQTLSEDTVVALRRLSGQL